MQVEQYFSDDYAGLTSGKYKFYYGYEQTDENDEWLFTVEENNKIVYKLSTTEIDKMANPSDSFNYPINYLLFGIGTWLLLKK